MIDRDALKTALTRAGRGRELALPGADAIVDRWRAELDEFVSYYAEKYKETVNPFAWWDANPTKARAFFEPDTLSLSAPMKAAVWRILLGFEIHRVALEYSVVSEASALRIELKAPGADEVEVFESAAADDTKLLRHLGSIRVNGKLQLQGYHAFAAPAA